MTEGLRKITKYNGFSIILIAFLWIFSTSAVSPALSDLAHEFPEASTMKIQLVSTLPFLTSIIFSVVASMLAKKFDRKKLIILGLIIVGVFGMSPGFVDDINTILLLRLLTGVGLGFIMPLPNIMITESYEGKKRERMLGAATSMANIANCINSVVIGFLLLIGWRACFYYFAIVFLIALNSIFGLPKSPPRETKKTTSKIKGPKSIPLLAIYYAICMILIWALFQFNILNMAVFITDNNLGTPWMIGIAIAIPGTFSIISGFVFPEFYKLCGKYFVFTSLLIFTIGFVVLFNVHSFTTLLIANAIIGLGQGFLVPYLLNSTSNRIEPAKREVSFGLVSGCIHVGILATAFFQAGIAALFNNDSVRFLYTLSAIGLGIATVIALIVALVTKSKKDENVNPGTVA